MDDVNGRVRALLARGWRWSESAADVLVHPADHGLSLRVDRAAGTLRPSAALAAALELVIPTPAGQRKTFWR